MLFWAIHFPCYFITTTISFSSQPQFTPLKKVSLLIKNFLILTCMTSSYQRWCCSSPIVKSPLYIYLFSVFSSVAQLCPTLCDPKNRSMPGLPILRQLPESTQNYVHWVGDAIQPSHPLSSPSHALNLSQPQGLFKWVSSSQSCQMKEITLFN